MAQYKRGTDQSGNDKLSNRVIAAVAAERDVDPLELPTLYDVIDPDALNRLFDHGFSSGRNGLGRVVFTLAGCEVVVHSDGEIDVTAPGERSATASAADPAVEQAEAEITFD